MSQQSPYTHSFRLLNRRSRIENSFAVVQGKEGGFAEMNNNEYSILLTYVLQELDESVCNGSLMFIRREVGSSITG
jgi:hypothetical protein